MKKTDRRHQLQQNELVRLIQQTSEATKAYLPIIGGAITLVVVVGLVYYFVAGRTDEQLGIISNEYIEAVETGRQNKLIDLTNKETDSPIPIYALMSIADLQLSNGSSLQSIMLRRDAVRKNLNQAIGNYTDVADRTDDVLLKQKAIYNRARAREILAFITPASPSDKTSLIARARADYQEIIDTWKDSFYANRAEKQLKLLNEKNTDNLASTAGFLAWLPDYKYKSIFTGGGTGSSVESLPYYPEIMKLPKTIEEALLLPIAKDTNTDSKTDDSKTDGSKTDDSKTDGSKTDGSKTDDSKTDGSKTDGSKTDDSKTDKSDTKLDDKKTSPENPADVKKPTTNNTKPEDKKTTEKNNAEKKSDDTIKKPAEKKSEK